jgi:hypothetical protein
MKTPNIGTKPWLDRGRGDDRAVARILVSQKCPVIVVHTDERDDCGEYVYAVVFDSKEYPEFFAETFTDETAARAYAERWNRKCEKGK